MRKVREVLRLKHELHLSHREVAESCKVALGTVSDFLVRAHAAGLTWPLPSNLSDAGLEEKLFPPAPSAGSRPLPDWSKVRQELRRKGVTLLLLWEEYHVKHPDGIGYSQFCSRYQAYEKIAEPRMRQVHKAGEKVFIDYCGQTVPLIDKQTGEITQAQIFVATLGASDYTFAEATASQSREDWIGSHLRALAFFGGVPEIVVPDNLKTGVNSPGFYEPELNRTYQELAEHYGIAVIPARVRKPRDKAKVENHVQNVERQILARLRDRTFFSLNQLNEAIAPLLENLNDRPFQKLDGTRRELFEQLDKPVLRPLPATPFVIAQWSKARVSVDYHIAVAGAYYSVPYLLIGREVDVRIAGFVLEVLLDGKRVATHPYLTRKGSYSTQEDHMPKAHQAYAQWDPQRLVSWANKTGPQTAQLVAAILKRYVHPQQGFRSCLGLLRLEKIHGAERLEAACARAYGAGAHSYRSVKSILESRLDQAEPEAPPELPLPEHDNVRGAAYYQ